MAALQNQAPSKRHEDFLRAVDWACTAIPGTATMLVTRNNDGLRAEDYLAAHRTLAQEAIAHPVWEAALTQAQADDAPEVIAALGYNAAISDVFDIARTAWEPLASGQTDQAPMAAFNLGYLLEGQGDVAGARAAYQQAIDSSHPELPPWRRSTSGTCWRGRGMWPGRGRPTSRRSTPATPTCAPMAAFALGVLLAGQGDVAGAGRPTSRRSTAATPSRPRRPR